MSDEQPIHLRRVGECTHCGECCEGCKHYDADLARCRIYEERMLRGYTHCVIYPAEPGDLNGMKRCTYKFVDEHGNHVHTQ